MSAVRSGVKPDVPRNKRSRISLSERRRARRLTLQALYQWLMSAGEPPDIAAQFHGDTHGKVDWDYFDEVFLDIPKQKESLEKHFSPRLDREPGALDPIETALLYLGTYELAFRIDVPYRVVINECVDLAKTFGATDSHKYINGVLDKLVPALRTAEWSARR